MGPPGSTVVAVVPTTGEETRGEGTLGMVGGAALWWAGQTVESDRADIVCITTQETNTGMI